MTPVRLAALVLVLSFAPTVPARAEVKQSSDSSLLVEHRLTSAATPAAVYRAVGRVGQWWSSQHSFSGKAQNLSLALEAGGCFCERWSNGSVEHGRVVQTERGRLVRLQSALGPLLELAVGGVLSFALEPGEGGRGTTLRVTYRVSGDPSHGLSALAPVVDRVIGEQAGRLARFAEGKSAGDPKPAAPAPASK